MKEYVLISTMFLVAGFCLGFIVNKKEPSKKLLSPTYIVHESVSGLDSKKTIVVYNPKIEYSVGSENVDVHIGTGKVINVINVVPFYQGFLSFKLDGDITTISKHD
jgi:hypothetical protein